ncbi:hypothetical protein FTUN_7643 [Frigoriglobus tundricola]|uniref:Uncharacterized protein n=1 Tax=Frigoriglobus tundricola TaxID=2774151 RepID=A0A6M5Z3A4_9BACT|nr:hypothetical protein FTUN_7643 [Frigoriglobus tundricola]
MPLCCLAPPLPGDRSEVGHEEGERHDQRCRDEFVQTTYRKGFEVEGP